MRRDRVKWNDKYGSRTTPPSLAASCGNSSAWRRAEGPLTSRPAAGATRFLWQNRGLPWMRSTSPRRLGAVQRPAPRDPTDLRDLDIFDIPTGRYDLILNTLYLNRRLFPQIREGSAPAAADFQTLLEIRARRIKASTAATIF